MPDEKPIETLLDEVEAYCAAATEGPWSPRQRNPDCEVVVTPSIGVEGERIAVCSKGDDTWFISRARTDLPRLVRELRQRIEREQWQPIEDLKEYGTFEVWLEKPDRTLNSQVGIANIHPNATIVNGHFAYDMPKILYVRPLPTPPQPVREKK